MLSPISQIISLRLTIISRTSASSPCSSLWIYKFRVSSSTSIIFGSNANIVSIVDFALNVYNAFSATLNVFHACSAAS